MIILVGKMDNISKLLKRAIKAGYGNLPVVYGLKLFLEKN